MSQNFHVAIMGAGLSGLALALALHKQNIACTLYEMRDAPLNTGGGVNLTPNGLGVLQAVGIYDSLVEKGFIFDRFNMQHATTGTIIETLQLGSIEHNGLPAMRAHRFTIIELLLEEVRRHRIPIHFHRRFSHITEETESGVSWQFTDGSTETASLLVGADGIYSSVRKYLAPDVKPIFSGNITAVGSIPTSQLKLPVEDEKDLRATTNKHPLPLGVVAPEYGAFLIGPQTHDGSESMITVMKQFPKDQAPADGRWNFLENDKDKLRAMFREGLENFPGVVHNAVSEIADENLHLWANYGIPHLAHWTSNSTPGGKGRVVVLGDAAHALPPSGGQGVNQAFEDVYILSLVLGRLGAGVGRHGDLQAALKGWQSFRQSRVELVVQWNRYMELRRVPGLAERESVDQETLSVKTAELVDALFKIKYQNAAEQCEELAKAGQ